MNRVIKIAAIPLLLLAISPFIFFFVQSLYLDFTQEKIISLFHAWQALIGAFFAIIAAIIGAVVILHQIDATKEIEIARGKRKAVAIRAILPLTLSALCDHALICSRSYITIYRSLMVQPPVANPPGISWPILPDDLIINLKDFIEANDEDEAKIAIILIQRIQIQRSRIRGMIQIELPNSIRVFTKHNAIEGLLDWAEIYAISSNLFSYARFDANLVSLDIKRSQIENALFMIDIGARDDRAVKDIIDRRVSKGQYRAC